MVLQERRAGSGEGWGWRQQRREWGESPLCTVSSPRGMGPGSSWLLCHSLGWRVGLLVHRTQLVHAELKTQSRNVWKSLCFSWRSGLNGHWSCNWSFFPFLLWLLGSSEPDLQQAYGSPVHWNICGHRLCAALFQVLRTELWGARRPRPHHRLSHPTAKPTGGCFLGIKPCVCISFSFPFALIPLSLHPILLQHLYRRCHRSWE